MRRFSLFLASALLSACAMPGAQYGQPGFHITLMRGYPTASEPACLFQMPSEGGGPQPSARPSPQPVSIEFAPLNPAEPHVLGELHVIISIDEMQLRRLRLSFQGRASSLVMELDGEPVAALAPANDAGKLVFDGLETITLPQGRHVIRFLAEHASRDARLSFESIEYRSGMIGRPHGFWEQPRG